MELQERLSILFARIRNADPARNARGALALVAQLIEQVEEEFCSVPPVEPPPLEPAGRMYPPQPDDIFPQPDGSIRARTWYHRLFFGVDGSITIVEVRTEKVEVSKPGAKV
jgi:hypothetical protein